MEYRIEYAGGRCYNYAHNRADLMDWLKLLKDETVTDIRKVYKSGASDSVIEKYRKYISKKKCPEPAGNQDIEKNIYKVIIGRKARKSNEKI